jgi:CRISPR-associated protein Cas2
MQFILVAYDIPEPKRRLKIANLLLNHGKRVQGSVFELWITGDRLDELVGRLRECIAAGTDSVRLYRLCAACQGEVRELGTGEIPHPPGLLII